MFMGLKMSFAAPMRTASQTPMQHRPLSSSDRYLALALGAVMAFGLLEGYHRIGLKGEDAALGPETKSVEALFRGRRLNAWQPADFEAVWIGTSRDTPVDANVLWLGNSQLHSINQLKTRDEVAPFHASAAVDRPIVALSLPNANLQELLVVFAWAISHRKPQIAIVGVFYDDLREDGLRVGLEPLDSEVTRTLLERSVVGGLVCRELKGLRQSKSNIQGTTDSGDSYQDRSEAALNGWLAKRWHLWRNRDQMLAALQFKHLYRLRNWAFGITPQSVRPMIPVRFEKNMAALDAIMDLARENGVRLLVYVPPLRNDISPPYDIAAYGKWQQLLRARCVDGGASFADYGNLVPAQFWGLSGGAIDFMHFQNEGHRLLGAAVVDDLGLAAPPAN
jgi:hypothetical protein